MTATSYRAPAGKAPEERKEPEPERTLRPWTSVSAVCPKCGRKPYVDTHDAAAKPWGLKVSCHASVGSGCGASWDAEDYETHRQKPW